MQRAPGAKQDDISSFLASVARVASMTTVSLLKLLIIFVHAYQRETRKCIAFPTIFENFS